MSRWGKPRTTEKCGKCGGRMVGCGGGRIRCVACSTTCDVGKAHAMYVPDAPDGYRVKGFTPLVDEHGETKLQWIKLERDPLREKALLAEAAKAFSEKIPRDVPRAPPKRTERDLLNCYVVTDFHLGALAWGEETRGADWDVKIAEELLVKWFRVAIANSPAAAVGIFAQLGDFLHWDGLDAVTPEHKNLLDADTRFSKLVRVAIRVTRRVVGMLLAKHERVHIIMAEGNHDPASSVWMREWFSSLYEKEPRVTVDASPDPYYCYEHGLTSLFFHHGHRRKPTNVSDVFVAKFRDVFGRTKHSYAHMGHLHNVDLRENNLMIVEQHRTLAAPDAYASRGGWMSGRDAQVVSYHKQFGEVSRQRISAVMAELAE
jgi:hypothetical protein